MATITTCANTQQHLHAQLQYQIFITRRHRPASSCTPPKAHALPLKCFKHLHFRAKLQFIRLTCAADVAARPPSRLASAASTPSKDSRKSLLSSTLASTSAVCVSSSVAASHRASNCARGSTCGVRGRCGEQAWGLRDVDVSPVRHGQHRSHEKQCGSRRQPLAGTCCQQSRRSATWLTSFASYIFLTSPPTSMKPSPLPS
jgi:hypothetical protein